ncbi:MAG: hypothetical protein ABFC62_02730 [Clostridiaceae bacterium]
MPRMLYKINEFFGLDQSASENGIAGGMSPDACNMDTADGALRVAKGFMPHIEAPVPGTDVPHRLFLYRSASDEQFLALAGQSLYAYRAGAWAKVYEYEGTLENFRFCAVQAQIGTTDYLIVGCGEKQLIKYDGSAATLFGSAAGVSDLPVLHLAAYKGRLFSAGDPSNKNRLYWSQLPGNGRTIESWAPAASSPNVEGGYAEVGSDGSDPITGILALSNQLLIFKRRSMFRLIGEKPGNFTIESVDAVAEYAAHTALVRVADAVYYLTDAGLSAFNGVTARTLADARRIKTFLSGADVSDARGVLARDKLLFAVKENGESAIVEYDLMRRAYMLRRGFTAYDLCARDGAAYLIDGNRLVCKFDTGDSYNGLPIRAWWRTPSTDLYEKGAVKAMRQLYLRGAAETENAAVIAEVTVGGMRSAQRLMLPREQSDVLEVPLHNEGRVFSLKFENEAGGRFSLLGGVELAFEQWRRVE